MAQADTIQTGNAQSDAAARGWFVGHFLEESAGLRHTDDLEIKWAHHKAGESRDEWVTGETRTTIAILSSGTHVLEFRGQAVRLNRPGDYVMWGEGADHRWRAVEDCVVLVIRWPSNSA